MVSIHLPLLPELFKPDHIYDATILARGHVDVVLALRIEVSAPELFHKSRAGGTPPARAGPDHPGAARPQGDGLRSPQP